jgi:hypothetical protein
MEKYKKTRGKKGKSGRKGSGGFFFPQRNSVDKHLAGLVVVVVGSHELFGDIGPWRGNFFPPSRFYFFSFGEGKDGAGLAQSICQLACPKPI